jgi:hypothetical protein
MRKKKYKKSTNNFNDDSGFDLHSEVLGSHAEHNPIYNSIKVCTKISLGLDYNYSWGEAPFPRKVPRGYSIEFVSGAGRRNERSPKILKIKVPIFQKKNTNNFHYDKRSNQIQNYHQKNKKGNILFLPIRGLNSATWMNKRCCYHCATLLNTIKNK